MHAPVALANPVVSNPYSETSSTKASPSTYAVEHLSDEALLAGARGLVARSNQQLARLLAHLAEVEARGIHRARACASLCAYCVYELRLSEDTAFRYARAAKLARMFPVLFEQIAAGEMHLTGLLLLGPHLTEENHREVLRHTKHRSKREIGKLVRRLDPLPDVPARIEPLGPEGSRQPVVNATWSAFMQALNPVRELAPRDRPNHWVQHGVDADPSHRGDCQDARHQAPTTSDRGDYQDAQHQAPAPTAAQQDCRRTSAGSGKAARWATSAEPDFEHADALDRDATDVGTVELGLSAAKEQEHDGTARRLDPQRYAVQFHRDAGVRRSCRARAGSALARRPEPIARRGSSPSDARVGRRAREA